MIKANNLKAIQLFAGTISYELEDYFFFGKK